jgi:hypothetical protein
MNTRTILLAAIAMSIGLRYQEESGEYLLATDDVLFVVLGEPPSASDVVPDDVRLAIGSLP